MKDRLTEILVIVLGVALVAFTAMLLFSEISGYALDGRSSNTRDRHTGFMEAPRSSGAATQTA